MAKHTTASALAACSLTAAPLFLLPSSSRQPPAVEVHASQSVSPGITTFSGTAYVVVGTSLASAAVLTAGVGRKQMPARIVRNAQADASLKEAQADASLEEAPPPPPPPPPFQPAKQLGAMAPLGFFDPLGFAKVGDKEGFNNLRAAELKHGRVAMMAAVGAVTQHFVKFPGFEKVPAGAAAVVSAPGSYGFVFLVLFAAVFELVLWVQDPSKNPGDFGDPVGLGQYNEDMRNREINNGRFAMFAALGIIAADLLTGKDAVQQLF